MIRLLAIYVIIVIMTMFLTFACSQEMDIANCFTPFIILARKNTRLNWFVCLVYTLGVYLLNPFWMFPRLIISICWFLTHVGRKESN